ncbi:hypothetical protein LTR36_000017 [Oleoguttula mirabilis]|uniref:Endoglucanase EG-II n=1 Tax=Oleoguttula mirabilis TaxID=1507867 RepID=A0AAV9K0L9_9PEZI|nr:hypothetical protein LTR36_000017 [Oleoguttula mirabilis]
MKTTLFTITAAAGSALAQQSAYGQCGGIGWTGATTCVSGYTCTVSNSYYSQCIQGGSSTSAAVPSSTVAKSTVISTITIKSSSTAAATSTKAVVTSTKAVVTSTKAVVSTSKAATSTAVVASVVSTVATTAKVATTVASSASSASTGLVSYAGVNIAGFDFGCGTDGTCSTASTDNPGTAGIAQMKHFVTDDGLNAFRLPVSWQYLVNNVLGGTLDTTAIAAYDTLVQGCLSAGAAMCIIDIHNYARWNGAIIGQGGPTNAQFASLWSQIATKYASNSKVTFGIMNEPHDVDITEWAATVQAAVTAIRQAGATTQKILLPGNDYTSGAQFISNGSGAALITVVNLDGSTTNLIFDVHQYLDSDNSGTNAACATNNVASFTTLGQWLRTNSRKAMLTETGGGATDSTCLTDVCQELALLNTYSDVFLGWTGWAAGMFATSYVLSETPTLSGTTWTDQELVTQCIAGMFKKSS